MQVQVTKDSWGVQVWFDWVELEYGEMGQVMYPKDAPTGGPIWLPKKTYWFKKKKAFSDKEVKKLFPDLGKDMWEGDRRIMTLELNEKK